MQGEGAPTGTDPVPAKWIPYGKHSTQVTLLLLSLQSCPTLCNFAAAAAAVTGEICFQFFTSKEGHTELGCSDLIGLSTSSV